VKGLRSVLILLLVAVLAIAAVLARDALQVGIGYSAKQLCSGVFCRRPARRISCASATSSRAWRSWGRPCQWLQTRVAVDDGYAEAEFLGARVRAVHRVGTGCTLHATGAGAGPLPPAVVREPSAGDAAGTPGRSSMRPSPNPPAAVGTPWPCSCPVDGELLVERYLPPVTAANAVAGLVHEQEPGGDVDRDWRASAVSSTRRRPCASCSRAWISPGEVVSAHDPGSPDCRWRAA
jgi:hypothetical protein